MFNTDEIPCKRTFLTITIEREPNFINQLTLELRNDEFIRNVTILSENDANIIDYLINNKVVNVISITHRQQYLIYKIQLAKSKKFQIL